MNGASNKKRWLSRAGKHATQANRLINIARRLKIIPSMADAIKKDANVKNNEETLRAYLKEAAILMRPSKDAEKQKDKVEERKDGGEMLMKDILTLDLNNSIHAAKCLRVADKHKVIAAKWRSQAQAEDRRMAKEENADPKKGIKRMAKQISTHSANSLRYVARDAKAAEGKKAGALTANPKIIDGVITRA